MLIPDKVKAEIATLDTLIADTRGANCAMETQREVTQTLVNQMESGVSAREMYFGLIFRKNKETVRAIKALKHEMYVLDTAVKANRERLPKYEQAINESVVMYLSTSDERYQGLQRTADEISKLLAVGKVLKDKTLRAIKKDNYASGSNTWIKDVNRYKIKFAAMVDICNDYMGQQAGLPFEKRRVISGDELRNRYPIDSSFNYEKGVRGLDGFMSDVNKVMEFQLSQIQTQMNAYAKQAITECRADPVEVR